MNEQAIRDAYNLFVQQGYNKSIDEFKTLIASNPDALNDSYNLFKSQGYNKSIDDYKSLMGVGAPVVAQPSKKKEGMESTSEVGLSESPKPTKKADEQGWFLNTVSALDRGFAQNLIGNPIKGLGTLLEKGTAKVVGGSGKGFISDALINFGNYFNKTIEEIAPQDESYKNSLSDQFGQAFGQVASLIATGGAAGVAGKTAGLAGKAGLAAEAAAAAAPEAGAAATALKHIGAELSAPTSISAGLAMGQSEYDRAKQAGATDDQAFEAFYKNAAVGSVLETIPVMQFFKRFEKASVGGVSNYLKTKGVAGVTGGIEEMTTEVMQQLYANKTAQEIYNTNQDLFEGVGSSGGVGFGVGFLLNAMGANAKILRKEGKKGEADMVENQIKKFEAEMQNGGPSSYSVNGIKIQSPEVIHKMVDNLDAADLAKANIQITNDPALTAKLQDKIVTSSIKEQVRQGNPDLNEPSLNAITDLEKELRKLEGNNTQTGKDKAAALRQQIKDIQENPIQEEAAAEATQAVEEPEVTQQRLDRISELEDMLSPDTETTFPIEKKAELETELETLKTEQDAFQKQSTSQGLLRSQQPQLGLQEVGEGNAELQVATGRTQETITPEGTQEVIEFGGNKYNVVERKNINIKEIDDELPSPIEGGKPINRFAKYLNNPEILTEKQLEIYNKLKNNESIGNAPILVSESNDLIDGFNRIKASLALGKTNFDIVKVKLITPEVSSKTPEAKGIQKVSVLITPATVRAFSPITKKIKALSLKYDKLVKQFAKTKNQNTLAQIKQTEAQIIDAAKQEVIDAVKNIDGVEVTFKDTKRGLWDGKFEPSFNMNLTISPDANTEQVSNLLYDFAEKYSQDAFILEAQSEFEKDVMDGKRDMPLTEFDENNLMHYPQIIYTFAEPITDEQVADLSVALQNNGIDAFSINKDGINVSVIKFLSEDEQNNLTDEEQYEQRARDFDSKAIATAQAASDVLGGDEKGTVGIRIKKSSYEGATNEGTADQTRQYNRRNVLEAFQQPTKVKEPIAQTAAVTEQVTTQPEVQPVKEQYKPIPYTDVKIDSFTKDNAVDYEEDEREGDNGRTYTYLSSVTVEARNADGDEIGTITKMADDDGILTFQATDMDGNELSAYDGFDTLKEAKQALADKYNKIQQKEFDKEQKKKAKVKEKEIVATVEELFELDPKDKTTLKKVSDKLDDVIKDIEKFEKENLGVNIALPIMKTIIKAIKALVDVGVSLQEAIKQVSEQNNVKERDVVEGINAISNIAPIQKEYDALMTKVDALIARQQSRGIDAKKIVTNVDTLIRKSDVYDNATDAQKKIMEREGRFKAGAQERRAPSIGRVLGVLKDITNITREEKLKVIKEIRNLTKDATKDLANEIRDLAKTGKITVNQAANVIARFGKVNMLNEVSVSNFVDYMAKVFKDAEYAGKVEQVRSRLKTAKKNIGTKIGIADGLALPLQRLFSINPNMIPDADFDRYVELVNMFGERKAVLTLEEKNAVTKDVQSILDTINEEQSIANELADRFNSFEGKVYDDDKKLDYAATINKMLEEKVIDDKEAEIMRKYKRDIAPQVEPSGMTEAEIEKEKEDLLMALDKSSVQTEGLPTQDERKLANQLKDLVKTDAVKKLSNTDLKNLLKVLDNIDNNYLPHFAELMVEKLNSINNAKTLTSAIKRAVVAPFSGMYAKLKSLITKKGAIEEMIRRNPLFNVDQLFGDFKTKDIFNSVLNKAAEGEAKFKAELKKVQNILEKAEERVAKSFKLDANKTLMSKFKMMTYLVQLENDSNQGNKQVNPASEYLKATIKHIDEGKSQFGERDAAMLQEILDKYTDEKGNIDNEKLYKSFNEAEKSAIKDIREVNESLKEKAEYTAAIIRGDRFNPLTNYVHLNVLHESLPNDLTEGTSFVNEYNNSMRPSTKAKSLIARTGKVAPLNFDVFASAQRGAKFVLMDYNLTEPIRTARKTINQTVANFEEEGRIPKEKREIINAINSALEETTQNLLTNSFVSTSIGDDVVDYINKQGYRAVLAGTSRFIAELSSNIGFAVITDPKAFISGVENRGFIMTPDAPLVMENVNSKETNRIFPTDTLSGKLIDTNILQQASGIKGAKAKSAVANQIQKIWNLSGKKYTNSVELMADSLISTPDKIIMRPMWFGSFANEFKKASGENVDFDKIAKNDEAYMNKHKEAIEKAKTTADERAVMTGATDNPFMGILKGSVKPNQSASLRAFNNFNNFMTKFLIFEYVTARTGIMAAMGNGSLSRKQGVALLGGVTTRMVTYTLLTQMMGTGLMGLFFDDQEDEDEKSFMQKVGQALTSAFTSMIFTRDFGNATKSIVNYGLENANEKYLNFLREGEYDPYKDAIQYSIVPPEKKGKQRNIADFLLNMGGAFGPALKTADFITRKALEPEKKKQEAIERREKEINVRIPLEVLGNAGFVPLYKDVRKAVMKELYSGLDVADKNAADKKRVKLEKLNGYETESDMKRYDPELWDKTYGPNAPDYSETQAKKALKKEKDSIERAMKDEMYNYTPRPKGRSKGGFGSSKFGQ